MSVHVCLFLILRGMLWGGGGGGGPVCVFIEQLSLVTQVTLSLITRGVPPGSEDQSFPKFIMASTLP